MRRWHGMVVNRILTGMEKKAAIGNGVDRRAGLFVERFGNSRRHPQPSQLPDPRNRRAQNILHMLRQHDEGPSFSRNSDGSFCPRDHEEAAEYQFWQLLAAHKIRVFESLAGFLGAYRIGDEEEPLMLCCQALVPALSKMFQTYEPRPRERQPWNPPPRGPLAWMN